MVFEKFPTQIPKQFFSITDMGQVLSVHRTKPINSLGSAIIGSILAFGGCLAVVYAVLDTLVQVARYGPIMAENSVTKPILIAIILGLSGLLAIWFAISNWNKSVVVYEKGLVYYSGGNIQTWLWPDIRWFFASISSPLAISPYPIAHQYSLLNKNGEKIIFDDRFSEIELLGNTISEKITPFQYRQIRAILKKGQIIRFGSFKFDQNTITIRNVTYPWAEIERFEIKSGYAIITIKDSKWPNKIKTPLSTIPNLDAFCTTINQQIGRAHV